MVFTCGFQPGLEIACMHFPTLALAELQSQPGSVDVQDPGICDPVFLASRIGGKVGRKTATPQDALQGGAAGQMLEKQCQKYQ